MSQKNVELIIGKLATDEEFREQFQKDPARALLGCTDRGFELTTCELTALVATDPAAYDRFADSLDPRLLKASLRSCQIEKGRS